MDANAQKDHEALYPNGVENYRPGAHRAEAKLYLPELSPQTLEAIDNGTDPHVCQYVGAALYVLTLASLCVGVARIGGYI